MYAHTNTHTHTYIYTYACFFTWLHIRFYWSHFWLAHGIKYAMVSQSKNVKGINTNMYTASKNHNYVLAFTQYTDFIKASKIGNILLYEGYCIDVLDILAKELDFRYVIRNKICPRRVCNPNSIKFKALIHRVAKLNILSLPRNNIWPWINILFPKHNVRLYGQGYLSIN